MLTSPLLRLGSWSAAAKCFMAICLAQAIFNVSVESYFISRLRTKAPSPANSQYIVYDSGYIAAQIFAAILAYTSLHLRSFPLVTTSTAFDLVMVVFHVAQLAQTGRQLGVVGLQATSISLTLFGCAGKAWVEWRWLRKEFGWQVYRALGADRNMQKMFLMHQLLLSASVLGGVVFVEFWLQLVVASVRAGDGGGGWIRNVFILCLAAVVLCMVLFAAVQELPWVMRGCATMLVVALAYFLYMIVCVNRRNRYAGGQKYLTVFLTILIVLDLALAVLCVVVCRTFNKGLRQRLRHFQILARGEVDLAAVSVPADVAEKLPKGEMSTKLRFFETEHARHSDSSTVRSEHRNEVRRWEMFSPGMADPELVRSFVAEGPKNPHMSRSFASGAQHKQMSRSFASETHTTPAITCSSVDGTVSCVLSSGEFGGAAAAHASTLSSFPSTSFSGVTTDRSFVGTRDFEDDKALYDTLQRPLELRVTNPDVYAQRRAAPSTVSSSTATLRTALSSLSEDPNEGFDEVESPLPPPAYIPSTSK